MERNIPFAKLPAPVKEAAKEYMARGRRDPKTTRWSWTTVRLADLADKIWCHLELAASFPRGMDFGKYHEWYVGEAQRSEGWPPEWAQRYPDSVWAIILEGPPDEPFGDVGIEDGWHRFHYYVDRYGPSKRIPVAWIAGT